MRPSARGSVVANSNDAAAERLYASSLPSRPTCPTTTTANISRSGRQVGQVVCLAGRVVFLLESTAGSKGQAERVPLFDFTKGRFRTTNSRDGHANCVKNSPPLPTHPPTLFPWTPQSSPAVDHYPTFTSRNSTALETAAAAIGLVHRSSKLDFQAHIPTRPYG